MTAASAAPTAAPREPALPSRVPTGRRVLAVIAGLLLGPGTGHFLLGRFGRGLVWAALVWLTLAAGLFRNIWLVGATFALLLASILDAALLKPRRRGLPGWGAAMALMLVLIAAQVGARFAVRSLVLVFKFPSGSMHPTLQSGDSVLVRMAGGKARRGDLVVFSYPLDPRKDFLKRVIAVGGDTIEFGGRELVLNGKAIALRQLPGPCSYPDQESPDGPIRQQPCIAFEEELDGRRYQVIYDRRPMPSRHKLTIPAGQVFVVGDNRDNSHDSRHWGPLPLANVRGRVDRVIWSSSPEGIRWERIDFRPR